MGAVYEAVDQRLDTVVALKETLFTDERLRKQFEREARLLARLHHQALPRVSDHFNEGDGQFLIMQYIPGEDLFEMQTRRQSAFSQEEVLRWADQLCDALDYLHTQDPQIIHRDIKPQNLKLTARGQIVLLDFGLAKGSGGQMSVVTTSASIFGYTPNYAPLEQVQGLGTDSRSDIYSLAATLYHLVTNVKPPDALSRAGAIVNGMPDPLVPADSVSTHVSRSVSAVLDKAMSQKRDDRYASASEMREALRVAVSKVDHGAATVLTSVAASTGANTVTPAPGTHVGGQPTRAFGNEAQTLVADDATKVRSRTVETATVVQAKAGQRTSRTWLAAAILLVVIAGGATGFYVYRARHSQAAQETPPTTQNPAAPAESPPIAAPAGTPVETAESNTAKPKTDAHLQKQASEKNIEVKSAAQTGRDTGLHAPHPNPDSNRPPQEPPPSNPYRNPEYRPPQLPPKPAESRVRILANGTRIETKPDGTRIVTFPNGATRVFPPGEMPNRRRRIPY
jgi:hypothetical protein